MNTSNFCINYPSDSCGSSKSEISIVDGLPDLISIYHPGKEKDKRYFFVTDATVASLETMADFTSCFDDGVAGNDSLLILGSGEKYKTIDTVLEIIKAAINDGFMRNDIFVGIGGGVICDITAFAASIYKRGVKVEFVPTTLLAMVDASIGGKTGCDFDNFKNMIGTFYPAQRITIYPEFVQSLPENQFNSGLAEAFKTSLLFNEELFNTFKNESEKILNRDKETLNTIISLCANAKANIVQKDFTEKGERAFLNLGHTFGHAYESICGLGNITHGEAVAWGIGRMVSLCAQKDICLESYKKEIFDILELYNWETAAIPANVQGGGVGERFILAMKKDKKNQNEKIRLILQKGLCDTFITEIQDEDIINVLK